MPNAESEPRSDSPSCEIKIMVKTGQAILDGQGCHEIPGRWTRLPPYLLVHVRPDSAIGNSEPP